jgi:cell fate regulator YaaT (PSP1 superfamily)
MDKIVGIRFKPAGKIYDFSCGAFVLKTGDQVIVETENGLGFGMVATPPIQIEDKKHCHPLKKVYRPATEKDLYQITRNA